MTTVDLGGRPAPQRAIAPRRGIWGWMLFDWAAQPFFTVVTTFIFGPYLIARMAIAPADLAAAQAAGPDAVTALENAAGVAGQAAWGYGIAAGGLLIAILSPILGSIADQSGSRKPWIGFFAAIQIVSMALLWFAAPGSSLLLFVLIYSLAAVAAEFSIVFNDSMIPRLMSNRDIGRISNIAWGLGYLGGMIVLIFVVAFMAGSPETGKTLLGLDPLFGLDPKLGEDARATGPLSALWYLVFVLPMFLFTPDAGHGLPLRRAISAGLSELKVTLSEVRRRSGIFRFLIGRMIYQDGVNALLALGGGFAAVMFGWSITELGIYGIVLNVVAILGCLVAARMDTSLGSKRVVAVSLVLLTAATVGIVSTGPGFTLFGLLPLSPADSGGLFGTAAEKAYILYGLLIGISFGPVQASSRSYLARSVSAAEAGRYFGIYALAGRATSFLAPFIVAQVTQLTEVPRYGMATILVFLVVGLLVLLATPYPAARPSAER